MSKAVRIRGTMKALLPEDAPERGVETKEKWEFLAKLGIGDRLAHFFIDRLTPSQWTALTAQFADYRQGTERATKEKARRQMASALEAIRKSRRSASLGLTPAQAERCAAAKVDPKKFAAVIARTTGRK